MKIKYKNGFIHLYILFFALIIMVLGYFLLKNSSNNSIKPDVTPVPTSTSVESTDVVKDIEKYVRKGTYNYYLGTVNNFKYEFEWEAYELLDKKNVDASDFVWIHNMSSLLKIVKTNIGNNEKFLVKQTDVKLLSAKVQPYLNVIQKPKNSNKIYFMQGREGTDGRYSFLLNFETGERVKFYPNEENLQIGNCYDVPPLNQEQIFLVYNCEFNIKEKDKTYEKLFSYDILTTKTKMLDELNPNEQYMCEHAQGYNHKYKYLSTNQIQLSVCDTSKELNELRTEIYNL